MKEVQLSKYFQKMQSFSCTGTMDYVRITSFIFIVTVRRLTITNDINVGYVSYLRETHWTKGTLNSELGTTNHKDTRLKRHQVH